MNGRASQRRWWLLGCFTIVGTLLGGAAGWGGLRRLARPGRGMPRLMAPRRAPPEALLQRGRRVVQAFLEGRNQNGFQRTAYLSNMLVAEPNVVPALETYLADWHALGPVAPGERLAGIDLLEAVARLDGSGRSLGSGVWDDTATDAEEALAVLVREPLPAAAPPTIRRTLGTEKHRALQALTRVDSLRALRVYRSLPRTRLTTALQDALLAGLIDRGLSPAQAQLRVQEALSQAFLP